MIFIGNKKIVDLLGRSLQEGNVAQAYLFSGPEHVGKKTLAEVFALSLISGIDNLDFSLKNSGTCAMDLVLVEPEREEKKGIIKTRDISVEKVREAQELLAQYPYGGKKKVLIIEDAHRLTTGAQNALLKTMEEPNSSSVLILVTHQPGRILPTLHSRMRSVKFSLAGDDEIIVSETANLAMGRPGMAKLLGEDTELCEKMQEGEVFFRKIGNMNISDKLAYAEKIAKDTAGAVAVLQLWLWIAEKEINNSADRSYVAIFNKKVGAISSCIEILEKTNANSRLAIENLLLGL